RQPDALRYAGLLIIGMIPAGLVGIFLQHLIERAFQSLWAAGVVPWVLAALLHFVREIVKDAEDEPGDRTIGRRTLPIAVGRRRALVVAAGVGLLFVPASLLLPRNAGYGAAYFLIALLAQMAVLVAATWLLLGKVERVSALLKGAMVIGLIALVAGKVA
ncbi:MAG TPA: hypothetical protein VKC15_06100, partial [Gemmatimonadales bacterium]|nr:hypothetical protein [Gemmatimonadales bacterium]